ncbi:hypothetical protein EVAR_86507_1 [Eumeta japonica]|uniref:Uncharacterized protein n=1 Tax=Eumeta variegata TaxID=151549 RepID=A0A4C1VNX0_EUMVA|nr:hypothetical protein EVAR_86507_1 [Eumeta japonica]
MVFKRSKNTVECTLRHPHTHTHTHVRTHASTHKVCTQARTKCARKHAQSVHASTHKVCIQARTKCAHKCKGLVRIAVMLTYIQYSKESIACLHATSTFTNAGSVTSYRSFHDEFKAKIFTALAAAVAAITAIDAPSKGERGCRYLLLCVHVCRAPCSRYRTRVKP